MSDLTAERILEGLSEHEGKVLGVLSSSSRDAPVSETALYERLRGMKMQDAQARSAVEKLRSKGVVEVVREDTRDIISLGELGERYRQRGSPESRLRDALMRGERCSPGEWMKILNLSQEEWGSAYGALKSLGYIVVASDGALEWKPHDAPDRVDALEDALRDIGEKGEMPLTELASDAQREEVLRRSRKSRGSGKACFRRHARVERYFAVAPAGQEIAEAYLRMIRQERLPERQYDFSLPPPRIVCGRAHPYRAFLDWVRRKLVSLGFEEMTGDMVESEFWNSDALYMPQFHPARAIHDVYCVAGREEGRFAKTGDDLSPYLERVAAAHENGGRTGSRGWRYRFDAEWTRRLVLRSQGTALSARWMAKPDLKIPGKYFGIARCFRNDTVDATHAPDFFQVEGIVVSRTIDMTHLLGLLRLFAEEVARAREVKFLPAYFPYTEPSVEVHIQHPAIGWMEMGGAGIFRPEVTHPLLTDREARVIAWGLGLDRMAMSALGIGDIRDLFSADLEFLRAKPAVFL